MILLQVFISKVAFIIDSLQLDRCRLLTSGNSFSLSNMLCCSPLLFLHSQSGLLCITTILFFFVSLGSFKFYLSKLILFCALLLFSPLLLLPLNPLLLFLAHIFLLLKL